MNSFTTHSCNNEVYMFSYHGVIIIYNHILVDIEEWRQSWSSADRHLTDQQFYWCDLCSRLDSTVPIRYRVSMLANTSLVGICLRCEPCLTSLPAYTVVDRWVHLCSFRPLEINIPDLSVHITNLIDQAQASGTCLDVCLDTRQQLGMEWILLQMQQWGIYSMEFKIIIDMRCMCSHITA